MSPRDELAKVFSQGWSSGGTETACGHGSLFASTPQIRAGLADLVKRLGIRRINDAGCGDLNWVRRVDLGGVDYLGYDLIDRTGGAAPFVYLDVTSEVMRPADLIVCRDVLVHLPDRLVLATLDNFRRSGTTYLLASSYNVPNGGRHEGLRGFSPMNLAADPYALGEPIERIEEPQFRRHLGLWRLKRAVQ